MGRLYMVLVICLLAMHGEFVSSQCVFSSTKCNCKIKKGHGMCLGRAQTSSSGDRCETHPCGDGYRCDCSGDTLCDIKNCQDVHRTRYRSKVSMPSSVGVPCDCEPDLTSTCLVPRTAPSASGSPTVSVAQPSSSSSPTATAQLLTVSPSGSPTPSITSQPLAQENESCSAARKCESGFGCSRCFGVCRKVISLEIRAIADNKVAPVMCGSEIGKMTTSFLSEGVWAYEGPCNDLFFKVGSWNGKFTYITAAVKDVSTGRWYATKYNAWAEAKMVMNNPSSLDFMSDPKYDFSDWQPALNYSNGNSISSAYKSFVSKYNADVWGVKENSRKISTSWYRIQLPFY